MIMMKVQDSNYKLGDQAYTRLPIDLNWNYPSKKHFEETYFDQLWETIDYSQFTWCINDRTLYFNIECSTSDKDWRDNFNYYPMYKNDDSVNFRKSEFKVHSGFYNQYMKYRNIFLDLCYRDDVDIIYVTGYSLGAAIATIAVQDAVYHFSNFDKKGNITSTSKKIFGIGYDGARAFCPNKKLNQYFDNHFMMVKNHCDPVVHCPPKFSIIPFLRFSIYPFKIYFVKSLNFIRYKDYGKQVWIGKRFEFKPCKHYPSEIIKSLQELK